MTHHTAAPLPKRETVPPLTPLSQLEAVPRWIFKWNICPSLLFSPILPPRATPPLLSGGSQCVPWAFSIIAR